MGKITGWWTERNETDPRWIAHEEKIREIARLRRVYASLQPPAGRRTARATTPQSAGPYQDLHQGHGRGR